MVIALACLNVFAQTADSPGQQHDSGASTNVTARTGEQPTPLPPVTVYGTDVPGLNRDALAATASRLDVPIRELPVSVSAIDRATMGQLGARNLLEAAQLAPGVTAAEPPSTPGIFFVRYPGDTATLAEARECLKHSKALRREVRLSLELPV